jgi:cytochrome c peroxidase
MAKVIPWLVISIVFFVAGSINNKASGSSGASADQKQQNSLDKSAAMDNAMSMHGSTSTGHDWNKDDIRVLRRLWIGSLPDTPPGNSNAIADNPDAVELGQRIFFDNRFSANGKVSCASCHKPELYFTDGLQVAKGIGTVTRNTPTVVGTSYNIWFFHDGRADSLWAQALGPLENPLEHGGTRSQYVHLVFADSQLRQQYEKLFGSMPDLSDKNRFPIYAAPIKKNKAASSAWEKMKPADRRAVTQVFVNIGKTIEAYERKLIPGPSKFDRYIEAAINNDKAKMKSLFSDKELAGLRVFMSKGNCMMCHHGPLFTDYGFHNTATPPRSVKPYDFGRHKGVNKLKKSKFNCLGEYNDAKEKNCDEIKYLVIHKDETYAAFKTPSLRNVTKTAPYMHAGQYKTLSDVLKHYADPPSTKVGMSDLLPVDLDDKDLVQLEAFLHTLDSPINTDPKLLSPYVP